MRENIETVQCGGWTDFSDATVVTDTGAPGCFPRFTCAAGINACEGFTGYTHMKNPDGSVPVCLSNLDAAGGQWDYLLMHELVHVKQFCAKAPGEPLYTTRAECCQLEREAYTVQCNAAASDGLFDAPVNGVQLSAEGCIAVGKNLSCGGFGPNACSTDVFPAGYADALITAVTNSPRNSCDQITTNPSPRVQSILDTIQRISDATPGTVVGNVPLPKFTAQNPDGSEDPVALPGRNNINPLGDPSGGLGERGGFEFPDSAFGYSSACNIYDDVIIDDDLKRKGKKIVFDFNIGIDDDPNVRVEDGAGEIYMNPGRWCRRDNDMEKATPRWCNKLYGVWQQMASIAPRDNRADLCDCDGALNGCPFRPEKRYCFDTPYTFECRGESAKKDPVISFDTDVPAQQRTCRTTWVTGFDNKMTECHKEDALDADGNVIGFNAVVDVSGRHLALSSSFYRHYAGNLFDPGITVTVPGVDNVWNVRAECYEYYKEKNWTDGSDFDPKINVTNQADEQCEFVIATDGEWNPRKPEWRPGEGQSQRWKVKAAADIVEERTRDPRDAPDPWVADTDTNLTMIDIRKLKDMQAGFQDPTDVTALLGTLITTRQTGSKTMPKNAHTDQFDDTAERKMAAFLEEQQRELLKMTADPQTRLIMPARFLIGLADDDPLFQYVSHTASRSDGTVEITLKAGLEDIGNVLKSFQRIFVAPTQEVRIPVLVPLVSVTEIDARIADWKLWKKATQLRSTELQDLAATTVDFARRAELLVEIMALDAAAEKADPLIAKLIQYRDRGEEVRLMRGALLSYLENFYEPQQQIREYFADWYEENTELLAEASRRAVQRRELKRIWRLLQRSLLQADACQLLWCSNQRYSLPVYSLLDNWWGDGESGDIRDPNYRPARTLLTVPPYVQPEDQIFDFSDVKFSSDPWLIPTLWPVQVRVALPLPPSVGVEPPDIADFPDLPPLPDDTVFDDLPVPSVSLPDKPLIVPRVSEDLEDAKNILREFRLIIDGTSIPDQINEEDALARGESIDQGDDNFSLDRGNMRGTYCRFPQSILIPPDSKDKKYISDPASVDHSDPQDRYGNPAKIVHVENDLRERLARLFSRWMPQREDDYAGRVLRLMEEFPPDDPPKCHEDVLCYFLPKETRTVTNWQWFMPDIRGGNFTRLGAELRAQTLPATENTNPYYGASRETLQRFFPLMNLPITTKLDVPRSAP